MNMDEIDKNERIRNGESVCLKILRFRLLASRHSDCVVTLFVYTIQLAACIAAAAGWVGGFRAENIFHGLVFICIVGTAGGLYPVVYLAASITQFRE